MRETAAARSCHRHETCAQLVRFRDVLEGAAAVSSSLCSRNLSGHRGTAPSGAIRLLRQAAILLRWRQPRLIGPLELAKCPVGGQFEARTVS